MGNTQSQWRFIARKIICKCRIFQLAYLMPYWLGYGGYGGTLVLGDWPWVVLATTLWNLSIVGGLPSIVTCIYQEISGFCYILFTSILHPSYLLMMLGIRCACAHCGLFFSWPDEDPDSWRWSLDILMEKMHHHRKKTHQTKTKKRFHG